MTARIDFGLPLAKGLRGEEGARRVKLTIGYAPEPPFRAGTPQEAGPDRTAAARAGRRWMDRRARLSAEVARRRLDATTRAPAQFNLGDAR